jgi:hypothetical protein
MDKVIVWSKEKFAWIPYIPKDEAPHQATKVTYGTFENADSLVKQNVESSKIINTHAGNS